MAGAEAGTTSGRCTDLCRAVVPGCLTGRCSANVAAWLGRRVPKTCSLPDGPGLVNEQFPPFGAMSIWDERSGKYSRGMPTTSKVMLDKVGVSLLLALNSWTSLLAARCSLHACMHTCTHQTANRGRLASKCSPPWHALLSCPSVACSPLIHGSASGRRKRPRSSLQPLWMTIKVGVQATG